MHLYKQAKYGTISTPYVRLVHLSTAKTMSHSSLLHFENTLSDSLTCLSDWKSFPFQLFQGFLSFTLSLFFQMLYPVARLSLRS